MNAKLILSLLLCSSFFAQAQRINHLGVANIIRQQCPACLDSNAYITAAAANVDSLDFSSLNLITDPLPYNPSPFILDSLTGFVNLKYLNVSNNGVGGMRDLPRGIKTLIARKSLYYGVPFFGDSLEHLDMGKSWWLNRVETNALRASGLKTIILDSCRLASIPGLPNLNHLSNLKTLRINFNNLFELPLLPNNLDTLDIRNNYMGYYGALPALPDSLKWFDCSKNGSLNCLTSLPTGLTYFSSDSSNLDCLPNIPAAINTILPVCTPNNNPDNCAILSAIEKSKTEIPVLIFPNPNKGVFSLQLPQDADINNCKLLITNSLGQLVFSKQIGQHVENISLINMATGIYNLSIQQPTRLSTTRIWIE